MNQNVTLEKNRNTFKSCNVTLRKIPVIAVSILVTTEKGNTLTLLQKKTTAIPI